MENVRTKQGSILVVDDQPNNLKVISSVLNEDYNLSIANSGIKALKILEISKPDLILLDVMMPEMDGYEVCIKIKKIDVLKDIPIIFLTAKADIDDIIKGFDLGAVDYITKPFNIKEVRVRINNHLSLARAKNTILEQKIELESQNLILEKAQIELKNKNLQLIKTNTEKDKFFSIIAHDLKSPFSGLLGLLEMMINKDSDFSFKERQEIFSLLFDSAKNVYSLIENLLQWSRIQQGAIKFNPSISNLHDLSNVVISLVELKLKEKNIKIINKLPENLVLKIDEMMISTIIRNLITNAIKFSFENSKIIIDYEKNHNNHVFKIIDNGTGIEKDIFEKLFKIDAHITSIGTNNEKGTGLGLILCKEFIEKHKGEIWVTSEVNKGSVFYFTLPIEN